MLDQDSQRLMLGAYILHLMAEANGGQEPHTIWQYRRVAKRFGVRIRVVPAEALQGAMLRRGGRAGEHGVIYVQRTRNMGQLRRHLLHELAEAAAYWEGVPPCVCQIIRHEAARCAEDMGFRRI